MKSFSIIVSSLNDGVFGLLGREWDSSFGLVLVHQITNGVEYDYSELIRAGFMVVTERQAGLSRSRNIGIRHCQTEYALLMDDDVIIDWIEIRSYASVVSSTLPDVSLHMHKVSGALSEKYPKEAGVVRQYGLASFSSVDICLRVDRVRAEGLVFDERFGLGTSLPSGEEFIFLVDCSRKGLRILFQPFSLSNHPGESSGTSGLVDERTILAKVLMLKRVFPYTWVPLALIFFLKKVPLLLSKGAPFKVLCLIFRGFLVGLRTRL